MGLGLTVVPKGIDRDWSSSTIVAEKPHFGLDMSPGDKTGIFGCLRAIGGRFEGYFGGCVSFHEQHDLLSIDDALEAFFQAR